MIKISNDDEIFRVVKEEWLQLNTLVSSSHEEFSSEYVHHIHARKKDSHVGVNKKEFYVGASMDKINDWKYKL